MGLKGNRGAPSFQWRSGLREPNQISARRQNASVTLFVDNFTKGMTTATLRNHFQRCGKVVDLFISTKIRKYCNVWFGFVRYETLQEARNAIEYFNGLSVNGRELKVSMARYEKGGAPVQKSQYTTENKQSGTNRIMNPALRDSRKYSEVVMCLRKRLKKIESILERDNDTIPVTHSLNVKENPEIASMLNRSVIAENTQILDILQITSKMAVSKVNETGMFIISLTKLLIVFATKDEANYAVTVDSPLWNMFDDVRILSEGDSFDDRLVWIECLSLHPLCWNNENLRFIGEKWGPVIHINSNVKGIQNITSARILVRTKAQNRIDNRVKLFYENGSCDVWVKEYYGNCGDSVEK